MSDIVTVALIASVPGTMATILGFLNNRLAARNERHARYTKAAMEKLEKNTNSMKDALVKVTAESEFARGKLEGAES